MLNTFTGEVNDCEHCAWMHDRYGRPGCGLHGYFCDNMDAHCSGPWSEERKASYLSGPKRLRR